MSTTTSMPPLPTLTLIVATTPSLGIGLRGTLPWPPLKADLAFFARVTKRTPPGSTIKTKNAVIMGRKTWESLPPKVRPLKGRMNVVVSRNAQMLQLPGKEGSQEPVIAAGSIEEGLRRLQDTYPAPEPEEEQEKDKLALGRVFVIGGAEIYKAALEMECCTRVLWTRLRGEWECDVHFPKGVLDIEGKEGGGEGEWAKRSIGEMAKWVGEDGVGGSKKEGEVEFEVMMLEKEGI